MIAFDISEIRYYYSELMKDLGNDYVSSEFNRWLACRISDIYNIDVRCYKSNLVCNQHQLSIDSYIGRWLPFDKVSLYTSGIVDDFYILETLYNTGVIYHVNEQYSIHRTL